MNILYISTIFPKENEGSTIYTDLAEALIENSHHVVVAMADSQVKTSISIERKMIVLRIKIHPYYNVNYLQKGIALVQMNSKIIDGMKKYLKNEKFDLILFESPPTTLYQPVKWAMHYFECPSYLMLKDIFPQNGVDIGLYSSKSLIYKFFRKKEIKLYKIATRIGCMSEANREYILKHNYFLRNTKINIFPNTKKINEMPIKDFEYPMRQKFKIPKNTVIFLFGGNMGKPQALDFLSDAIVTLKDEKDIFFLMVGRGSEKKRIAKKLEKNKVMNYLMLDNLQRDDYEKLVNECDVGLILLDSRFTIPNYPSRILSYMDCAMPVIAATDRATDILQSIEAAKCGLVGYSDDMDQFIKNIRMLSKDDQLRFRLGMNGRQYFMKHFDVSQSVKILEKYFEKEAKNV